MCMFPTNSEHLISISDAFSTFRKRVSIVFPTCSLYPQQKRAYSALHPWAWTYIYRSTPVGTYRVQFPGFPKIVYWFCLFSANLGNFKNKNKNLLWYTDINVISCCSDGNVKYVSNSFSWTGLLRKRNSRIYLWRRNCSVVDHHRAKNL